MPVKRNHKIELDPDAAAAALCKKSFYFFVQEFWDLIIPEEPVWNWHIKYLCTVAQEIVERVARREEKLEDLIINIPPGTSKTTIMSIMLPAWAWAIDPTLRILTISYSDSVAMQSSVKSRSIIESDRYTTYFPGVTLKKDQNAKTNYENVSNGQRYAAGLGASITGIHFHIILTDDPLNPKEAVSEKECLTASETLDSTVSTRKVNKEVTVTILIMQRLSDNDPTAHMLEKIKAGKKVRHICLPADSKAIIKPKELETYYVDGLLDPVRMSRKVLADMKIDLGSANYAGQFDQSPAPAGGLIWKRTFFKVVPDAAWPDRKFMTMYGTDWDTAYTKEDENAASAWITAGKIGHNIYIDDLGYGWWEFPELIKTMKSKPAPHYIEAKASGKSSKQVLSKAGVLAIEISVSGGDKIARANMATPIAEAGHVYVRQSMVETLLSDSKQGILNFPRGKFKDLADALAQSLQRLGKQSSISSSTGQEEDDDD